MNYACKGEQAIKDIKENIEPKFSKPDAMIREYPDSKMRARLEVEDLGNNFSISMLDEKCIIFSQSMEEEVLLDTRTGPGLTSCG